MQKLKTNFSLESIPPDIIKLWPNKEAAWHLLWSIIGPDIFNYYQW